MAICRLLNGLWQVSGGHGAINPEKAIPEMLAYHDAGFTTWDLADHYGPAEDFIGQFRKLLINERGSDALKQSLAFTKWVPRPERMTRQVVEAAINVSLRRMQVECLDLLQFHWWDYSNPAYMDALRHLSDLQQAGKIRHLALTNFDTGHLRLIVEGGIRIVSNQVQFSLVDMRPTQKMIPFCQQHGITLLTYGTYCGGLLSEKYLGTTEPGYGQLGTASLRKYMGMINAWGGWGLFQELLITLKQIADKHQVSIANVAVRAILDQPAVAGVIAGTRLGVAEHRADNARVFDLTLDAEDVHAIEAISKRGQDLMGVIGDCGDEYRR
jgi:aryl-alcohol dehydrogenase-like predicted oxidoreductase